MFFVADVLTGEECSRLCQQSLPLLTPSLVQYGDQRVPSDLRLSFNYRWQEDNEITAKIKRAAARAIGDASPNEIEAIDVVRYPEGGYFGDHHDGHHRSHTFCVTLQKAEEGGEIQFAMYPRIKDSPDVGCALLWENDSKGTHRCEKVIRGEKWVAVAWRLTPQ